MELCHGILAVCYEKERRLINYSLGSIGEYSNYWNAAIDIAE